MDFQITCVLVISLFIATVSAVKTNCKDLMTHKNFDLLPKGEECLAMHPTKRIMGGKNAELGEFPWIVMLLLRLAIEKPWCTGSIINSKYVLTAAHCVTRETTQHYQIVVRVGEHDLFTKRDCDDYGCAPPARNYAVEEYIPHPQYRDESNNYDLGLVRVKGEMHWNAYVHPACLPMTCDLTEKTFEGETMVVAGFGALYDDRSMKESHVMQKVALLGVNPDACPNSYVDTTMSSELIICAGGSAAGDLNKDACHGDSGGPLIYRSLQDGPPVRPYVVGVVSGGERCIMARTEQAPGIYTRLASHMDWILDNIRE